MLDPEADEFKAAVLLQSVMSDPLVDFHVMSRIMQQRTTGLFVICRCMHQHLINLLPWMSLHEPDSVASAQWSQPPPTFHTYHEPSSLVGVLQHNTHPTSGVSGGDANLRGIRSGTQGSHCGCAAQRPATNEKTSLIHMLQVHAYHTQRKYSSGNYARSNVTHSHSGIDRAGSRGWRTVLSAQTTRSQYSYFAF